MIRMISWICSEESKQYICLPYFSGDPFKNIFIETYLTYYKIHWFEMVNWVVLVY